MQVKLKVLAGKNSGKELPVPVKRFLIGRGDDCHMRPKSEAISRNHCAILINDDEDEVIIRDLNSRNGTYASVLPPTSHLSPAITCRSVDLSLK
ncbi:MAG: FHA domain-containing protein [Planctomycetia bacterium]|nr:FHA domain-containing protein [Planctomycetia bacterium]